MLYSIGIVGRERIGANLYLRVDLVYDKEKGEVSISLVLRLFSSTSSSTGVSNPVHVMCEGSRRKED